MDTVVFVTLFGALQIAPFVLVAVLRRIRVLSRPATIVAASLAALVTAACWYIAFTDTSSSTAAVAVIYAPFYSIVAVMLVIGADQATRAGMRRWRRHGNVGSWAH